MDKSVLRFEELIGKRCLFRLLSEGWGVGNRQVSAATELKVLEVAPSGAFVKTMSLDGRRVWHETKNLELVEPLNEKLRATEEVKPLPFQALILRTEYDALHQIKSEAIKARNRDKTSDAMARALDLLHKITG